MTLINVTLTMIYGCIKTVTYDCAYDCEYYNTNVIVSVNVDITITTHLTNQCKDKLMLTRN